METANIKIVEGLLPWQVMKRASEGEVVTYRRKRPSGIEVAEWVCNNFPQFDWATNEYGIIDTSTPAIDWDKFDWDFFNQYGGLRCTYDDRKRSISLVAAPIDPEDLAIVESPFYYWLGGEQPVPDMVEVEVERVEGVVNCQFGNVERVKQVLIASGVDWNNEDEPVVGFKLTGRVL